MTVCRIPEVRTLADNDGLNGALAWRSFCERARIDAARASRRAKSLSCALIDIDRLKHINDRHGHAVGDLVIEHVASICTSELRPVDYIGRIGGDTFALMFSDMALLDAFEAVERLCRKIEATPFKSSGNGIIVSVSAGLAELVWPDPSLDRLLQEAYAALDDAKRDGRNGVACNLGDLRVTRQKQPPAHSSGDRPKLAQARLRVVS
jgi:diguanylate cyclase (GGDEF)-like protein